MSLSIKMSEVFVKSLQTLVKPADVLRNQKPLVELFLLLFEVAFSLKYS